MATFDKVDREAVEKFFTWESPTQLLLVDSLTEAVEKFFTWLWQSPTQLLLVGALISLFVGLASLLIGFAGLGSSYVPIGLIALGFSIYLIWEGIKDEGPNKYYNAVQKAKAYDFSNVLVRSFKKTEMDIDSLLDFDAKDLVSVDPTTVSLADRDLIKKLDSKAVFLYGSQKKPDRWQLIPVDGQVVLEYSPIFVSILYLTRSELIIYFANIDITRGDLQIEEINRAFLKDVVKVTVASKSTRIKRVDNEDVFKQFKKATQGRLVNEIIYHLKKATQSRLVNEIIYHLKKATQSRQEDEIIYYQNTIRLSMTDGQYLSLPVGEPEYRSGEQGILDLDPTEEEEGKFTQFAREIFKRINDAKRTLHDNDAF